MLVPVMAAVEAETEIGKRAQLKIEGALTRYHWTFADANDPTAYMADGATDSIKQFGASIGLRL